MNHQMREDIINATIDLISKHGFHRAPMAKIAQRANVAAGTIYRFFDSKDDLIGNAYTCLEQRMRSAVLDTFPEYQSIRNRYQHVCRELVNYFLASPTEFRFIEQFFNSPYGATTRRERIRCDNSIISEIFLEGIQQRVVKNLPLPILNSLTFGPLTEICRNHVLKYFELNDHVINSTVEACWDAIRQQ